MIPIDEVEWLLAEQLKQSGEAKLPRKTKHSLLNFNSRIFAIRRNEQAPAAAIPSTSNAIAGISTHSQVKRMMSQQGETAVVKIMPAHKNPPTEAIRLRKRQREARTLHDLGMSDGLISYTNNGRKKYYLHMQDLGLDLLYVLKNEQASLTDDRRLDLAIDACLELADLHYFARKSRSRTRYAHGDVKPDNFTIDASGKLRIVDHGTTKTKPQSKLITSWGTRHYAPPQNVIYEKWKYDILGLKRSLLLPEWFLSHDNKPLPPSISCRNNSILTPELVKKYNFERFIDTSMDYFGSSEAFRQDKTTALSLAAILIAARHELAVPYQLLVDNSYLSLVIVDLYLHQLPPDELDARVTEALAEARTAVLNPERITHKAVQINRIHNLGLDEDTIRASEELTKLINQLEHLGLIHHIHKIQSHPVLRQNLLSQRYTPQFYQNLNWFLEEIPDHSEHLDRLINAYLEQDPLIALLIRRQLTRSFHATVLDEQQREFLTWCDQQRWSSRMAHHVFPRVILNPVMLKAMLAVWKACPDNCKSWMSQATCDDFSESAALYLKAACLLQEKNASPKEFESVFKALNESEFEHERQQAVLIMLENNISGEDIEQKYCCKHGCAVLIGHLSRLNLLSHLPKVLTLSATHVLILNKLVDCDFEASVGAVLSDASLMAQLALDWKADSIYLIKAAQFLNQQGYPFESLTNKQANDLFQLSACVSHSPEARQQKISEIMTLPDSSQSDEAVQGLLPRLKTPSIQAACSSSEPEPEENPVASIRP